MRRSFLFSALLSLCILPTFALQSQSNDWQPKNKGLNLAGSEHDKGSVHLVSATEVAVPAAQFHPVTLKFLINTGMHINSHTPHSVYLIPTNLTLDAPAGMHIAALQFPQGTDYHFQFAPKDAISVYTNEFAVDTRVKAAPGTYTVPGKLHYQACDNQACNPPRTLQFTVQITAK